MRWSITAWLALLALVVPPSFAGETPTVTQLLSTRTTIIGQPIRLPQGDVQVTVSRIVVPAGGILEVHKHPWSRYAYVLEGTLSITLATGQVLDYKAGDFIIGAQNIWHFSSAGNDPVVLLVIDQAQAGHANVVHMEARH